MGEWVIQENRLSLTGEHAPPTADDIFRSVIEGVSRWPDIAPGKSGAAQQLAFSKYPAIPTLVLTDARGVGEIIFEARLPSGVSISLSAEALKDGHLIESQKWYPLDSAMALGVAALARQAGLPEGGEIRSLRSILELKKVRGAGLVDDRLTLEAGLASRLAPPAEGVPLGVQAILYPYQLDGWRWLRFVIAEGVGGLLGDEMGLGKTLQVISAILDSGNGTVTPTLVVAPGSLLENWCREITRFAPSLSVLKHHGPLRTGSPTALDGYDVIVTSYETVLRDGAMMEMRNWALVVLDEAQNIRNPNANRTRAVKRLRRSAGLAVTGTPMENRLLDIWSILDFVCPGYLGTEQEFSNRFVDSVEDAEQLEPVISPLILRRRVAEVAQDLPERIDIPQVLEMEPATAGQYDQLRTSILAQYGRAASLVALTKLRMFCAHPELALEESSSIDFVKLQRLDELVSEIFACGEKVLVFTSYTEMADKIANRIASTFNVFARTLDGRLPIPDRQGLIDRFAAVKGGGALIVNPKAGGAGLNITAANHVIHYNPEWNPALEDQASARVYRRGQTRPVTVHRLLIAGTVEEVIDERLMRKRSLSTTAVVGVEGGSEDLQDIVTALDRSPLQKGIWSR